MLSAASELEKEQRRKDLSSAKRSGLELLTAALNSRYAVFGVIGFFILALLGWLILDHKIPGYDPAWHAIFSSSVRRYLTHPKEWSLANLILLGKQHYAYPPGAWAFNGFLKVFLGDSNWGDKLCLVVQSLILAVSFYKLSMMSFQDRLKANLGLIVLLSFPLICMLQHLPTLDLLQVAMFTCFYACLGAWSRKPSWKNTLISALVFGFYCLCKQISVLYSVPVLGLLFLRYLFIRDFNKAGKIFFIGITAALFLGIFWVFPNLAQIQSYLAARAPSTVSLATKLSMMLSNLKVSSIQLLQSMGPYFLLLSLSLLSGKGLKNNAPKLLVPALGAVSGWLLIITYAYYNAPEPRYFAPVLVPVALLLGALGAEGLRSSSRLKRMLALTIMLLAPAQMFFLCFQPAPAFESNSKTSAYELLGVGNFRGILAYNDNSDPWKQRWVFDKIEAVEKIRYVWLNVLPGTWEYNQGSMSYLGHQRKSHVIPITWRGCQPDMSDSF
ncbi:MAG: glycosyltransferase family 39 protein, partial [Candidatus Obscuribacterales bacterium]|nr:glycosyltransferase family 39 protein [Candidatus Obscuribacterales bacterium]